jgi:hypothetical protein
LAAPAPADATAREAPRPKIEKANPRPLRVVTSNNAETSNNGIHPAAWKLLVAL